MNIRRLTSNEVLNAKGMEKELFFAFFGKKARVESLSVYAAR